MTRGQIRDLTSVVLDDVNNGYFTTAQLNVWINNNQREIQKQLLNAGQDYYTICATAPTVANLARYTFPSDFVKLQRLSLVVTDTGNPDTSTYQALTEITRMEQDNVMVQSTGNPIWYYVNKDFFTVLPTPTSVITMHMDYSYRVADMSSDSDVPDVPEDYHEYMAILSARDGFLRDGRDLAPIQQKLKYYDDMLTKNKQQRTQDAPRGITRSGVYF